MHTHMLHTRRYRVISGHLGWVRSLAVDASNTWFATGSADRTIKIWDLASGQLKLTLTGHIEQVGMCGHACLCMAVCMCDGTLCIFHAWVWQRDEGWGMDGPCKTGHTIPHAELLIVQKFTSCCHAVALATHACMPSSLSSFAPRSRAWPSRTATPTCSLAAWTRRSSAGTWSRTRWGMRGGRVWSVGAWLGHRRRMEGHRAGVSHNIPLPHTDTRMHVRRSSAPTTATSAASTPSRCTRGWTSS